MDTTVVASRSALPSGQQPVLAFEAARVVIDLAGSVSAAIDLALPPGSLMLIDAGDRTQMAMLADAAIGLAAPVQGRVLFLGRDWSEISPLQAQAMRGRIGHVFGSGNWIDGLSLRDNILLPQLYHTRRPLTELLDEAARLAAVFGLPGLPLDEPNDITPADLQRAACVRAFLGRPKLIVLEHPMQDLMSGILEPLVNAARAARDRDAAVLWLTPDAAIYADPSVPADYRFRLRGGSLHAFARAAA